MWSIGGSKNLYLLEKNIFDEENEQTECFQERKKKAASFYSRCNGIFRKCILLDFNTYNFIIMLW